MSRYTSTCFDHKFIFVALVFRSAPKSRRAFSSDQRSFFFLSFLSFFFGNFIYWQTGPKAGERIKVLGHDYGRQHLNFAIWRQLAATAAAIATTSSSKSKMLFEYDATMKLPPSLLMGMKLKRIQLLKNINISSTLQEVRVPPPPSPINPIKLTSQGYNANGSPKRRTEQKQTTDYRLVFVCCLLLQIASCRCVCRWVVGCPCVYAIQKGIDCGAYTKERKRRQERENWPENIILTTFIFLLRLLRL